MPRKLAWHHRGALALAVSLLSFTVVAATPIESRAANGVTEFSLGGSSPVNWASHITTGPDGALWFTEPDANEIGRMTTGGGLTVYPLPAAGSLPTGIAAGSDGALWFTEPGISEIGRITTSGGITQFADPSLSQPYGMAAGPDGNVWFTEEYKDAVGRITPAGTVTEFPLPSQPSGQRGIAAGPDGAMWLTARIDPFAGTYALERVAMDGSVTQFPIPAGGDPQDLATGPDGALWFTQYGTTQIGRMTTAGSVIEYPATTPQGLWGIAAGPDGAMWFGDGGSGYLGRITTGGAVSTIYAGGSPSEVTAGPDGAMWFAQYTTNQILRVQVSGPGSPVVFGDVHLDTYNLPSSSTDSVSGSTAISALRAWQFQTFNGGAMNGCSNGSTGLCGAQVTVSTPSGGYDLTSSSFGFAYQNPQNGSPPAACPPPSTHTETCPSPGVTIGSGSTMGVSSSPNPQTGVPVTEALGYDSARSVGATSGSDAPASVSVTLNDPRYQVAADDNQVFVGTFADDVDGSAPFGVTANGSAVPPCPQAPGTACVQQLGVQPSTPPPNFTGPCASIFLFLDHAAAGTQYALNFSENETTVNCLTGKPGVRITAEAQPATTNQSCDSASDCSVTVADLDPSFGTVTFSTGPGQVSSVQTFAEAQYVVQYMASGNGGGGNPPPPAPAGFSDTRLDTINLASGVNSYSGASSSATRDWELSGFDGSVNTPCGDGTTGLCDAQVTVNTAASGVNLQASNNGMPEFQFSYANGNGTGGGGGSPCPSQTPTSETCPSPGVTISSAFPNNTLNVSTSPNPQSGVPISTTLGYSSTRTLGAVQGNGDAPASVAITLNDARYQVSGNDNQLFISSFSDNVDPAAPFGVTANGAPVPQCPQPPGMTCVRNLFVQPSGPQPGFTGPCNSIFLVVDQAQNGVQYSLNFSENESGAACPTGYPGVRLSAESAGRSSSQPCDGGTDCSVTLADPALGNVTFSVGPGQVTALQTSQQVQEVLQYMPSPAVPACPSGVKVNFRWHYSANGSSGSWSGTKTVVCPGALSMGPQAMEGNLLVSPGTILKAGYDFTVPGNKASFDVTVSGPSVRFTVRCASGAVPTASTFTVAMATSSYAVTNSQWYPSGDQSSPSVYQGSTAVPDLCHGGQLSLSQGGTFTSSVS